MIDREGGTALTITYAIMAIIATILLIGYFALVRKKEPWLLLLYICVTVINVGYFLLSISKTVGFAIFANDVVYFGSVFISTSMLLTITKLCGFAVRKRLVITLFVIGALMFLVVATVGILPWYYKEVELIFVDGAAKLKKVYGVLHPLYLVYLLGYFAAMVACIVQSVRKKVIASQRHASFIAAIVFGNIAVWLVEKFIPWDFEFLSVSYIFSEIVLLGLYWMMQDYVNIKQIHDISTTNVGLEGNEASVSDFELKLAKILSSSEISEKLSTREREILELILLNKKRKEIALDLHLSENTIKTYTRTLYAKLGVGSREEIFSMLEK